MVPQGVANCVVGFSKIDLILSDQKLWDTLAKAALAEVGAMNSQDVANCMSGFIKVSLLRENQILWDALRRANPADPENGPLDLPEEDAHRSDIGSGAPLPGKDHKTV